MPIGKFTTQPKIGVTETRGNGSQILGHGQLYQGSQRFGGMAPTQPIHPITRNMQPVSGFGPELSRPQTPLLGENRQFDPTFRDGTPNQYRGMPGGTITSGGNMHIDPNFGVMPGGNAYRTMQPVLGGRMQLAPESPWLTAFKRLMARHRGGF